MPSSSTSTASSSSAFNNIHERTYRYAAGRPRGRQAATPIRLDFHEFVNDADIHLVWSRPHGASPDGDSAGCRAPGRCRGAGAGPFAAPRRRRDEGAGGRLRGRRPRRPRHSRASRRSCCRRWSALGKPVVLVLLNGSAVAVNWARDHVPAIVEALVSRAGRRRPPWPTCCSATTIRPAACR